MPISQLSAKAISELLRGEKPNQPILQLVEAKPIKQPDNSAPSKFKGLISDSTHQTGAIFTSALSSQLIDGTLRVNAIIRLRKYLVQKLGQNKMVVIMGVDVVEQLEVRASRNIFYCCSTQRFLLSSFVEAALSPLLQVFFCAISDFTARPCFSTPLAEPVFVYCMEFCL